jgi:hypothetical protein
MFIAHYIEKQACGSIKSSKAKLNPPFNLKKVETRFRGLEFAGVPREGGGGSSYFRSISILFLSFFLATNIFNNVVTLVFKKA